VALTNSSGNTVQVYEYDVYGRVGATDASHPNRFMFTGREFDKETGLYYYRARYYNPQIGRFLQTDPIGYGDGMNMYAYCGNNPLGLADPSGMASGFGFRRWTATEDDYWKYPYSEALEFYWLDDDENEQSQLFSSIDDWMTWARDNGKYHQDGVELELFPDGWEQGQVGWTLAGACDVPAGQAYDQQWWFWHIKAICWLGLESGISEIEAQMNAGAKVHLRITTGYNVHMQSSNTLYWNPSMASYYGQAQALAGRDKPVEHKAWMDFHPLAGLAHELRHVHDDVRDTGIPNLEVITFAEWKRFEIAAMKWENTIRRAISRASPSWINQYVDRPQYFPPELLPRRGRRGR